MKKIKEINCWSVIVIAGWFRCSDGNSQCTNMIYVYRLGEWPRMKRASSGDGSCLRRPLNESAHDVPIYASPYMQAQREYFQAERGLLQAFGTGCITEDPSKADLFWVDHSLVANWIRRKSSGESTSGSVLLQSYWHWHLRPALERIYCELPYFNASGGRDHIFVYVMDSGPICEIGHSSDLFANDPVFKAVIHPMIHIEYDGGVNVSSPKLRRSSYRSNCFRPGWDINIPMWNSYMRNESWAKFGLHSAAAAKCRSVSSNQEHEQGPGLRARHAACDDWYEFLQMRATMAVADFFFSGSYGPRGHSCSVGVRPWLRNACHSKVNTNLPKETKTAISSTLLCSKDGMWSAAFALCPAGCSSSYCARRALFLTLKAMDIVFLTQI